MPRFSIVVPAYNAVATLGETLDAVLGQRCSDWECVVVDDGSTDDTLALAEVYARRDSRIRTVHQENQGSAGAYNTGVRSAGGDYVVLCSADDILLPEHLASMAGFIEREPAYDIYSSNGYLWTPGQPWRPVYDPKLRREVHSLALADVIRVCFYSVGAVYRRGLFDEVGGYREGVFGEDYDFWLRAMARGARHRYLPDALSLHRVSPAQKSADLVASYRSDIRLVTELRRDFDLGPEELRAVGWCLHDREKLIAGVEGRSRPVPKVPVAVRSMAVRVLGERRIRVLAQRAKARMRRGPWSRWMTRTRRQRALGRGRPRDPHGNERSTPRVLVIASWYPGASDPTAGIFIREQVRALSAATDVAVVHVAPGDRASGPWMTREDGGVVVRVVAAPTWLKTALKTRRSILARFDRIRTKQNASGAVRGQAGGALPTPGRAPMLRRAILLVVMTDAMRRAGLAAFECVRAQWGGPDIVHVQALWPAGLIACTIKRRYGIPYVVTEHSEEYLAASERRLVRTPGVVRLLLRPLALGASRTIAVSRFLAERLMELGLAVNPVVIPNVVPVSDPVAMPAAGRHVIAHVSIMGPAKNIGGLLRAVDELRQRRDDFVLLLIGDGESRPELERLAAALELTGKVEFTGRVDAGDVRRLLGESAFTVISSTHETFSVVAAESLMCGRPVLATRCGGPEEFVSSTVGRLIEAGSVEALVGGLDWMLDHHHEFDPQALHDYAVARFAPGVVAEQILAVYRQALGD